MLSGICIGCTCKPATNRMCIWCSKKKDRVTLSDLDYYAISDTWTIDGPLLTASTATLSRRLHHPQNAAIAIDLRLSRQADGTGALLEVAFFSSTSETDKAKCRVQVYMGSIIKNDVGLLTFSRDGTSTSAFKLHMAHSLLDTSPEKKLAIITTIFHKDHFWGIKKPMLMKDDDGTYNFVYSINRMQPIETAALQDNMAAILTSGQLSDVTFVVGGKEFLLHRAILAARSPVFATMFTSNFEEKKVDSRVEIVDIQADVFEQLVKYLYIGQVPDLKSHAQGLYLAADKYQLESLKFLCEYTMWTNLTIDSIAEYLNFADHCNARYLKMKCIQFVYLETEILSTGGETYAQLAKSEGWQHLKAHRPELIRELFGDCHLTI